MGELKLDYGSLMSSGFRLQPTEVKNASIGAIQYAHTRLEFSLGRL